MTDRFEYIVRRYNTEEAAASGLTNITSNGWELVSATPTEAGLFSWRLTAIFRRARQSQETVK